jgi:ketosteroid isomerase-like protein
MTAEASIEGARSASDLSTPERTMASFVAHVHSRDLEALMTLYEPDAVFHPSSGGVPTGTDEIRGGLAQLLTLKPPVNVEVSDTLSSGDIALVVNDWLMTGTAPDGSEVAGGGRSADVLRRQADGC